VSVHLGSLVQTPTDYLGKSRAVQLELKTLPRRGETPTLWDIKACRLVAAEFDSVATSWDLSALQARKEVSFTGARWVGLGVRECGLGDGGVWGRGLGRGGWGREGGVWLNRWHNSERIAQSTRKGAFIRFYPCFATPPRPTTLRVKQIDRVGRIERVFA